MDAFCEAQVRIGEGLGQNAGADMSGAVIAIERGNLVIEIGKLGVIRHGVSDRRAIGDQRIQVYVNQ